MQVEAGNSRFNEMQERQMTAGSPLGSLNGLGSSPALAATSPMADTAEELQQPSLSPFNDAAQLRQPSSDASDDGLCDLEVCSAAHPVFYSVDSVACLLRRAEAGTSPTVLPLMFQYACPLGIMPSSS